IVVGLAVVLPGVQHGQRRPRAGVGSVRGDPNRVGLGARGWGLERFRLVRSTAAMVLLPAEAMMAAPYSIDLRERVLKAWETSGDADEVAATFGVSRAWVHRLAQRERDTGSIAPRKQTKFRSRVLAGKEEQLKAVVNARPDATLAEIREALPTTA